MHYFILAFIVMVGKCAKIGGTQGFSAQLLDIVGHRDLGHLNRTGFGSSVRVQNTISIVEAATCYRG